MSKIEIIRLLRCPTCGRVQTRGSHGAWMSEEAYREQHADDERVTQGEIEYDNVQCEACQAEHPSSDDLVEDVDGSDDDDDRGWTRRR